MRGYNGILPPLIGGKTLGKAFELRPQLDAFACALDTSKWLKHLQERLCHLLTFPKPMVPTSFRMHWQTSLLVSTILDLGGAHCMHAQQTPSFPSTPSGYIIISNSRLAVTPGNLRSWMLSMFGRNKRTRVGGPSQLALTQSSFEAVDEVSLFALKLWI
jgi:hypothetical protein